MSLDLLRPGAEVAFDFADTVARLAQTPLQRRRVDIVDDELSTLGYLSRYEAEAAVDARARLDPDWLGGLLASGREQGTWDDFVRSPAAAPVLRAAARGLDRRKSGLTIARFLVLLEAAVAEALSSVADNDDIRGMDALAHFWAQALRIGAVNDQERILQTTGLWVELSSGSLTARDGMCLMSLFGWAREVGNPSLVLRLMRSAEGAEGSAWLDLFFGPGEGDWSPEAVDDSDVARLLTHSQAMDLRWALQILRQAAGEETRVPETRRDKRRRG